MFHTCAYTGSVGVNANDTDLPALADGPITISNNHFVFMVPAQILGAYCIGASVTRGKIQTPKTRALANPYIRPVERSATVPQRPNFADLSNAPVYLNPIDETQFLISNNLGAATEQEFGVLWVSDGPPKHQPGQTFTIRATTAVVTVANVWSNAALVFDQVLPAGRYSVVGMAAIGTGLLAARLFFTLQVWRPGVLAGVDMGKYAGDYFHRNSLGEFGQFMSIAQPTVDFLSIAAATNPEVYLDLVKIG